MSDLEKLIEYASWGEDFESGRLGVGSATELIDRVLMAVRADVLRDVADCLTNHRESFESELAMSNPAELIGWRQAEKDRVERAQRNNARRIVLKTTRHYAAFFRDMAANATTPRATRTTTEEQA